MNVMNNKVASILGITVNLESQTVTDDSDAMNLLPEPLPPMVKPPRPPLPVHTDKPTQIENDAEYARDNLYDVISKVNSSIDELMSVASQSQSPRAYEVLNQMLNTQRETAAMLLKLQADRQKVNGVVAPTGGNTNINVANAIFTGTSAELLDALKGKNRKEENQIIDAEFLIDDDNDSK